MLAFIFVRPFFLLLTWISQNIFGLVRYLAFSKNFTQFLRISNSNFYSNLRGKGSNG